jgi:ubiquinone/menaquinone biosynthesis C-methylase UbiE
MVAMPDVDTLFTGSIAALYDTYLGPLIFEPYAEDLASRLSDLATGSVLETAAGTGIVTRALLARLPAEVSIVATDLNQPMLDYAASQTAAAGVRWQQADAQSLPFADGTFDAVVCQFGAMFFPDRPRAYREARRVLKPGGRFLFNVWDRIEENEFASVAASAVAGLFPDDPPNFLARTPHGYHDVGRIAADLDGAGFREVTTETVVRRSSASSSRHAAIGFCQGTPLRNEIEARARDRLVEATEAAAARIAARFGSGPIDGKIQALVITAHA